MSRRGWNSTRVVEGATVKRRKRRAPVPTTWDTLLAGALFDTAAGARTVPVRSTRLGSGVWGIPEFSKRANRRGPGQFAVRFCWLPFSRVSRCAATLGVVNSPRNMNALDSDATMAVFLDLENIALGARDSHYPTFDIKKVIERLLLKGHIVVKKAYCDFERYKEFKRDLHEAAFELIEIPHVRQSGKNSADIRMVVDALDLCYTKGHVDTFVILSGDSDFSPLVSKLRENAKTVIGFGVKNSSSDLFINNCDEFLYYDDL